jgi:DNA (cytosine-5)-methyltransferase 1
MNLYKVIPELERVVMSGPVTIGTHKEQINHTLDNLYYEANSKHARLVEGELFQWILPQELISFIDQFWQKAPGNAESAITNLTTCLVCKLVEPAIDCRYHREPGNGMLQPPGGQNNYFSGRTISEDVVAPWLKNQDFVTSNSGWQTRTFERPRPYTLEYPENIRAVKDEFLHILDEVQSGDVTLAREALEYLIFNQIAFRESQRIQLTIPNINSIQTIISFFDKHFFASYSRKGASRLPVLAIYAVYSCVMAEIERYQGYHLAPLQRHEAADVRTGAIGDIQIFDGEARIFEAFEIKHEITIDKEVIRTVYDKFRSYPSLQRCYILTTATICGGQDADSLAIIQRIRNSHGAEVIANGVLPTIKYFLRLLKNPSSIFPVYVDLLARDRSVSYEHRQKWNEVVIEL